MQWVDVFAVFLVSHLVGDYLLQTDWQARHKHRGLAGDPVARRALISHILTYTLAFTPALVWIAGEREAFTLAIAAAIAVPHLVQDDGRLVATYIRRVKRCEGDTIRVVGAAVDQTLHVIALFAVALVTGT